MKIRIKFSKLGVMKFIGHLDIMRYFQKAMRRANIPIAYSAGFSPHQIMSFASPLGVGLTSNGEYMDIELTAPISSKEAIYRLNEQMSEGMQILSFLELPDNAKNAMSSVAAADYTVMFRKEKEPSMDWKSKLEEFYKRETIPVTKQTKKNEIEMDLKEFIYSLSVEDQQIHMKVASGSVTNIKPELVMETFAAFAGFTLEPFSLLVHRDELYTNCGENGEFIWKSLDFEATERL